MDLNYLQDTSDLESPVTIEPLPPKYYENKFLDKIDVVGTYKVKGEVSYYLMPFYKIKVCSILDKKLDLFLNSMFLPKFIFIFSVYI